MQTSVYVALSVSVIDGEDFRDLLFYSAVEDGLCILSVSPSLFVTLPAFCEHIDFFSHISDNCQLL